MRLSLLSFIAFLLLAGPAPAQNHYQLFDQVWSLVEEHFHDPTLNGLDSQAIREEAKLALARVESEEQLGRVINRFLARLETSHTHFYSWQEPEYYQLLDVFARGPTGKKIRERFDGELPSYVGILATVKDGIVTDLVPGGPAALAGLRRGDRILSAEGKTFHSIASFPKAGQAVRLELERDGVKSTLSVVPRRIQPREAFLAALEHSMERRTVGPFELGYLRVYSYAGEVFHERVQELLKERFADLDGLVFDIRGGWGGAQPSYLELFQPLPVIEMTTRDGESFQTDRRWNRPVALLIDDNTRSGKEILAYGFVEQNLGPVVGETATAGAVSAGRVFLLPGGRALYLAVAKVTIDDQVLEGAGVRPTLQVATGPLSEDMVKAMGWKALELEILKKGLLSRGRRDQAVRFGSAGSGLMTEVDQANTSWLAQVVEHYGWPLQSQVGEKAASSAWLIVQHSSDLAFQQSCLELMMEAVERGEASAVNLAYLTDRVRMRQGRPQIWGTQLKLVEGRYEFWTIEDPETVDARRAKLGLPSLEEYRKSFP